jgi:HEAT repeat protein
MNAGRKRFAVVLALLLASALAFLAWKSFSPPEPVYHGKPLRAWLGQSTNQNETVSHEAKLALQEIGTNGIPFLLDLMRAEDSSVKKKLRAVLPRALQIRLRARLKDTSSELQEAGARGLFVLGTNAVTAVPALIEIGKYHPVESGRYLAVAVLGNIGPPAEAAVPFLVECLTNKSIVAYDAADALGRIHSRPEIAVPAMIKYLESPGSEKVGSIYMLAWFGTNAKPAVPLLLSMLDHPNRDTREAVTNCVPRIDAEAAAKAQLKPR